MCLNVWLFLCGYSQSAEFLMMKNPLWLLLSVESLEGVLTLALCDMGPRAVINSAGYLSGKYKLFFLNVSDERTFPEQTYSDIKTTARVL